MTKISRRSLMAAMATAGATALCRDDAGAAGRPEVLSQADRKAAVAKLLDYFRGTAPKLLQPEQGLFKYPSISPTLPGAAYNGQLWDWDTLWTTMGLFSIAKHLGDRDLHGKICEHAKGSLLNFFDHQSDEGRIPIMMMARFVDPFGCLKKASPNKANQAKPVMAQLGLLVANHLHLLEPA